MSSVAISIETVGKQYRIASNREHVGLYRYKTVRESLVRAVSTACRAIGSNRNARNASHHETFWALKDVTLEIKCGEVVGLIGGNGAGKSTLLKLLSRITEPTIGRIRVRGRVASLLEVGTGFHPELTGRENIYLNGALLGMTKKEIHRKFDEIVAFAGTENFLETPVKHYSSGMYVRLAFAVAAHLEHETLLVDEVLAVGDASFQKKCFKKMDELATKDGRTVVFVSHNMAAVKRLTERGVVLAGGQVTFVGTTASAIQAFLSSMAAPDEKAGISLQGRGVHTAILRVRLLDAADRPTRHYTPGERVTIEIVIDTDGTRGLSIELFLLDEFCARIGFASIHQFHGQALPEKPGVYTCRLDLEPLWLASGSYYVEVRTSVANICWDHCVESACSFEVPFSNPTGREVDFKQSYGHGPLAWLLASRAATFRLNEAKWAIKSEGSVAGSGSTSAES
jgi:lipopolysaccharide transport system ATP-binding protein